MLRNINTLLLILLSALFLTAFTVEEPAKFPGGDTEMYKWIADSLRYPEAAAHDSIQGCVVVQFAVEKDGSVGDAKVIRGKHPDLDAEAIRIVKTFPNFSPGKMNGTPVRVWYTLPIIFKLPDDQPQPETTSGDEDTETRH